MGAPEVRIDPMRPEDRTEVRRIYLEGIATGNATFESTAPAWKAWDAAHLAEPRLARRPAARTAQPDSIGNPSPAPGADAGGAH